MKQREKGGEAELLFYSERMEQRIRATSNYDLAIYRRIRGLLRSRPYSITTSRLQRYSTPRVVDNVKSTENNDGVTESKSHAYRGGCAMLFFTKATSVFRSDVELCNFSFVIVPLATGILSERVLARTLLCLVLRKEGEKRM